MRPKSTDEHMRKAGYAPSGLVARTLGRDLSTIHRWAAAGKVESTRCGQWLYISIASLRSYVEGNKVMERLVRKL